MERLRLLGYKIYSRYNKITIYKDGYDKIRIERAFGSDYSIDRLRERVSYSRQYSLKPIPQQTIFQRYLLETKSTHKGIYGLYLYYCYLLNVFPTKQPKQYLSYEIRKDIKKLELISEETRFMASNHIETKEDLTSLAEKNYQEYSDLVVRRRNLWQHYRRAKTEDNKSTILNEINTIQPKIKELRKINKYCKDILARSEKMQDNINNFDKDLEKEKDNQRTL